MNQIKNSIDVPKFPEKLKGEFWGITSFFNPAGYKNKYKNYLKFRESSKKQGLKLVAVELAFDDKPFELKKSDADILVQIRGTEKNIMWQKERLLNIALEHLPKTCDKVAWLDCDIIFENNNWVEEASKKLEKYKVVQLFSMVVRLPEMKNFLDVNSLGMGTDEGQKYPGMIYALKSEEGRKLSEDFPLKGHSGFGWAARREVFEKIGFYEKFILGNGDYFMFSCFFGDFYWPRTYFSYEPFLEDLDSYGKKLFEKVQGSVYFIGGNIFHLWHGQRRNRFYKLRNKILSDNFYNPAEDVCLGKNNLLEWSTDKERLIQGVKEYFFVRREDSSKKKLFPFFNLPENSGKLKILYILRKFLVVSETFVANEIFELVQRGHDVRIVSLGVPLPKQKMIGDNPKINFLTDRVLYIKNFPVKIFEDFLSLEEDSIVIGKYPRDKTSGERFKWFLGLGGIFLKEVFPKVYFSMKKGKDDSADKYFEGICGFGDKIISYLGNSKPDIVYSHFCDIATDVSNYVSKKLDVSYVFFSHGFDFLEWPNRNWEILARGASKVFVSGEYNRNYISNRFCVPPEKIQTIRLGVDNKLFRGVKEKFPVFTIVCVSRLVGYKGHKYLIQALEKLKVRGYNFKCLFIGDGNWKSFLELEITKRGLKNFVELLGNKDNKAVAQILSQSHLHVLASLREPFGVSTLEAMSCSLPVIASDVMGARELVDEGKNGFLVKPKDFEDLARKIELLILDEKLREKFGKEGRKIAFEKFSSVQWIDSIENVLKETVNKKD